MVSGHSGQLLCLCFSELSFNWNVVIFTQFIVHFCWHNHHPKYFLHSFTSLWFSGNQLMLMHEHEQYPLTRHEKLSHKSFIEMVCVCVFTGYMVRWSGRIIDFLNSKNNNFNVKLITYLLWQTMRWFREKQQQKNSANRSVANQQCFDIFHLEMFRLLRDRKWYCSLKCTCAIATKFRFY